MVSADNLPFDVLPLIFHFLSSGTDLVAIALVSKSFSSAALPLIYDTINVRMDMAKRLRAVISPFHTLLNAPLLQPFVRNIAINSVPLVRHRPSSVFLLDLCKLLPKLKNLSSFAYTAISQVALLPPMLPGLVASESLKELKITGENLSKVQADMLTNVGRKRVEAKPGKDEKACVYGTAAMASNEVIAKVKETIKFEKAIPNTTGSKGLEKLWLKSPSPAIMYKLEEWVERNKDTLRSLSVLDAPALSTGFLQRLLNYVPRLTTLTMTQCPDIDHWKVLQMVEQLPELKSLCINIMVHTPAPSPSPTSTSLKHLRCLFLISHPYNTTVKVQATVSGLLGAFNTANLESFTLESMEPTILPLSCATSLVRSQGQSVKRLNFLYVVLHREALDVVCKGCEALEQLCVDLGTELKAPLNWFTTALSSSRKLHTLVDGRALKPHHDHGGQDVRLTSQDVSNIATLVPTLRRVINANRCWNVAKGPYGGWVSTASRINPTTPPLSFIRDT